MLIIAIVLGPLAFIIAAAIWFTVRLGAAAETIDKMAQ